jgi:hypothetical protein
MADLKVPSRLSPEELGEHVSPDKQKFGRHSKPVFLKTSLERRRSTNKQTKVSRYRHACQGESTVHRPGDDPRKECEECGNARGSNVRYYPT